MVELAKTIFEVTVISCVNGKQIGFVDEPGIIILNYTYANFIKNRILTIYNGSWL